MKYDNEIANTFIDEAEAAGYDVRHYRGRFFWEGPAVVIPAEDLQGFIRSTSMPLKYDSMGRDSLIVHPAKVAKLVEA